MALLGGVRKSRRGGCSPLPGGLDRAEHDPQDQPDHEQVAHHLDHGGDPGPVGDRDDVAEADGGEHRDGEVQGVGPAQGSLNAWGWASASMT